MFIRAPDPQTKIEMVLFKIMAMFHPRPFLMTRFSPQGAIAVIRARNKAYFDIVFR